MERAGDILKNVFSPSQSNEGVKYNVLFKGFRGIVGESLARHVVLRDIDHQVLVAEVDHPGWLSALLLKKELIIRRVNKQYPGLSIKDIRVRVIKKPLKARRQKQTGAESANGNVSQMSHEELDELLSKMDENELKRSLKKLFTPQARRKTPKEPDTG